MLLAVRDDPDDRESLRLTLRRVGSHPNPTHAAVARHMTSIKLRIQPPYFGNAERQPALRSPESSFTSAAFSGRSEMFTFSFGSDSWS